MSVLKRYFLPQGNTTTLRFRVVPYHRVVGRKKTKNCPKFTTTQIALAGKTNGYVQTSLKIKNSVSFQGLEFVTLIRPLVSADLLLIKNQSVYAKVQAGSENEQCNIYALASCDLRAET